MAKHDRQLYIHHHKQKSLIKTYFFDVLTHKVLSDTRDVKDLEAVP
jgi:hypothetical protein